MVNVFEASAYELSPEVALSLRSLVDHLMLNFSWLTGA